MPAGSELEFQLPDLRFVAIGSLRSHERHDPQRMAPLGQRIREHGVIKNPPVVAPLADAGAEARFVVLDGANRGGAARPAGLPHLVVQVGRYGPPSVQLRTWYHALGES